MTALPCECAGGASCRCFVLAAGQSAALLPDFDESWFLGSAVPAKTWRGSWFLSWGHCLHCFCGSEWQVWSVALASRADVVPCGSGRSFATSYKFGGFSSGSAVEVHAFQSASFLLTFFWQGRKKSAAGGTGAVLQTLRQKRWASAHLPTSAKTGGQAQACRFSPRGCKKYTFAVK